MLGQPLQEREVDLYVEEMALDPAARSLRWREPTDPARLKDFTVTVIGAGMGGLNAALQLRQAGFPFTVIEKNAGVGGTWWENRYPGRPRRYGQPLVHPPLRRRLPLPEPVLRVRGRT